MLCVRKPVSSVCLHAPRTISPFDSAADFAKITDPPCHRLTKLFPLISSPSPEEPKQPPRRAVAKPPGRNRWMLALRFPMFCKGLVWICLLVDDVMPTNTRFLHDRVCAHLAAAWRSARRAASPVSRAPRTLAFRTLRRVPRALCAHSLGSVFSFSNICFSSFLFFLFFFWVKI